MAGPSFCRKAAGDLEDLVRARPGLRIEFVQNAITSQQSEEAARVDLAAFRVAGAAKAYALHQRLYARRGLNNGRAALTLAGELGLNPEDLQRAADGAEVRDVLTSHMRLAASLGLTATPSFVINGVELSGYPGPDTMRRIIDSVLTCDAIAC